MSFMEFFVEDLLILKEMNEGILLAKMTRFNLNKTFQFIVNMFSEHAHAKGIKISLSMVKDL